MSNQPDPFDDIVLDGDFIAAGTTEKSAEERIAQAKRIARNNDRLRVEGEISDGAGKPRFHRARRVVPWVMVGAIVGGAIIVVALLARR